MERKEVRSDWLERGWTLDIWFVLAVGRAAAGRDASLRLAIGPPANEALFLIWAIANRNWLPAGRL